MIDRYMAGVTWITETHSLTLYPISRAVVRSYRAAHERRIFAVSTYVVSVDIHHLLGNLFPAPKDFSKGV